MLVITGPTATGKTRLAAMVAREINGEIISADSRQVYRSMTIGTGKDIEDYTIDGVTVPYHLIDICDPGYKYNLFEYLSDFREVYSEIVSRGNYPLLCGGSGLYVESVIKNYKLVRVPPDYELRKELEKKELAELTEMLSGYRALHNVSDTDSVKRAVRAIEIEMAKAEGNVEDITPGESNPLIFVVEIDREMRRERISKRLEKRLGEGMIEEVEKLLAAGVEADTLIYYGLEYKFITQYLKGELSYSNMVWGLETAIHQFAKRQMTWFRGMERRGIKVNWLDGALPDNEKVEVILNALKK